MRTKKTCAPWVIWYNETAGYFSINHVPRLNIRTEDGTLEGNYWRFTKGGTFSFNVEPFLDLPAKYRGMLTPLAEVLSHED